VSPALGRIDRDVAHRRQVDHDPAVARRGAGHVVPPAAHRDLEVAVTGEAHRGGHIGGAAAPGDEPGPPVDGAVPQGPGVVVVVVAEGDEIAPDPGDLRRGWC
jgi:hypothetical protein